MSLPAAVLIAGMTIPLPAARSGSVLFAIGNDSHVLVVGIVKVVDARLTLHSAQRMEVIQAISVYWFGIWGLGSTRYRILSESAHDCGNHVLRNCCTRLTRLPAVSHYVAQSQHSAAGQRRATIVMAPRPERGLGPSWHPGSYTWRTCDVYEAGQASTRRITTPQPHLCHANMS